MRRNGFLAKFAAAAQAAALAVPAGPAWSQPVPRPDAAAVAADGPPAARLTPFRFDRPGPIETPQAEAPMSLTASDGTGLKLVKLGARAVVEGPLAFTELQLSFQNPEPRIIEGQFRITLPLNASVSRFAMKTDQGWQEGEVVDRGKARAVYEDFLHRRQDPALLEAAAGNEFSARVFPIPANGVKELILSYSQELPRADAPYVLPLKGMPQIGELDAAVSAGGRVVAELKRSGYVPGADFEASLPRSGPASGLRNKELAVVRVRPILRGRPEAVPSLMLLVDTSASRALGFEPQVRLVRSLIEGLARGTGPATPVTVAAFDQAVEPIYQGEAGKFGDEAVSRLRRRRAMGASDLGAAFRWAEKTLKTRPAKRVLLVTDGVATAGPAEADELRAAVRRLKAAGAERLDAVAVGGIRDEDLLKRLVTAGLEKDGAVVDGKLPMEAIGAKLTEATVSDLEVAVEGAGWVWPRTIEGLQAKDDVFIFAELPQDKPLRLSVGGRVVHVPDQAVSQAERPLVERACAKARIASLLRKHEAADGREAKDKVRAEIVELSVRHRVVSPFTSLLVLETLADYARYGIDRKSLADILTVKDNKVAVVQRPAESLALREPPPPDRLPMPSPGGLVARRAVRSAAPGLAGAPGAAQADRGLGALPGQSAGGPEASAAGAPEAATAGAPAAMAGSDVVMADRAAAPEFASALELGGPGGGGGGSPAAAVRGAPEDILVEEAAVRGAGPPGEEPQPAPMPVPEPAARRVAERRESRALDSAERARMRARAPSQHGGRASPRPFPPSPAAGPPAPRGMELPRTGPLPYTGKFKDVMELIRAGKADKALASARAWVEEAQGDVMALVALGEAYEALGDLAAAARAYGSIIDLFPNRADLRRYAGERLERVRGGLDLAVDTYEKAVENRPDHPSSHRLLAFALLKKGLHEKAFEAMAKGASRSYPDGRFRGVDRILREDLGLIAAAWMKAEPGRKADILQRLRAAGGGEEAGPSVRFVLNWETDANDVDFHIYDGKGGHAYYSSPSLPSGGELYADVTTGYGPECFTIRGPKPGRAYPYTLQAHYYSRGPMGYGMGKLQVIEHDGKGGLTFEERPFVVMVDQAFLDLGRLAK